MKKRLFLFTTLIVFAGLLVFFALTAYITHENNLDMTENHVMETAQIYADIYTDDMDISYFSQSRQATGYTRITVIASDGTVLADSHSNKTGELTENYLNRPEIQAALNGTPKTFVRYSETLKAYYIYYALIVNNDDDYVFVRAAVPVAEINAYMFRSFPLLVILLIAVALFCFLLIRGVTSRVLKLFNSIEQKLRLLAIGKYDTKTTTTVKSYKEIEKITKRIDDVTHILQKGISDLNTEKNKLDYIISNIGVGIFAVDDNNNIALINNVAIDIFDVTPDIIGKSLNNFLYEYELVKPVKDCVKGGKDSLFESTLNGRIYIVTVNKLPKTGLTIAILSDVTDNRKSAKQREEFFANASHELKTPLAAIKMFNELTAMNSKEESIRKYIDGITKETERMLSLIGDMLKLSELDTGEPPVGCPASGEPIPCVSLANIANEVGEALSTAINKKGLTFEITGDGVVNARHNHVYDVIKNLVENSERYNNHGGKVSVVIDNSKLIVSDNGIGISPREHSRIFERFYRVEKSRSQANGGTGLGLSIVKHICALYGWKLSLKSKLGTGTEVTVEFGGMNKKGNNV